MKTKILLVVLLSGICAISSTTENDSTSPNLRNNLNSKDSKIEANVYLKMDSVNQSTKLSALEESKYQAIIDNLASAYAPISIITSLLGIIIAILGIIAALGIYLIGLRKDRAVKEVIDAKHSEIDRVIQELVSSQKREFSENIKLIKEEDEKRNKIINEYQAYLKERLSILKEELSKSQSENKVALQNQIDDIHEKIFKAPLAYSFGTSATPQTSGTFSELVNSASAFAAFKNNPNEVICSKCGTKNRGGLVGISRGFSKCTGCGQILNW